MALDLNQEPDEGDGEELPDLNVALGEDSDDAQGEDQNIPVNQEDEEATEQEEIHSEDDLQAIYDAMMQEEDNVHDGK
jgi:hypothetical protein